MSDKDYNNLLDLAKKLSLEKPTLDEVLQEFVRAGILDEKGNLTPPYASLAITPQ